MSTTPNTTSTFVELEESTAQQQVDYQLPSSNEYLNNNNSNSSNRRRKKKRKFIINTKCGSVEMTIERILSFIVMLISLLSFVILAIVTVYALFLQNYSSGKVYQTAGRATFGANRLSTYFHVLLGTNATITDQWLLKINTTFAEFKLRALNTLVYLDDIAHTGEFLVEDSKSVKPIEYTMVENSYFYLYNELVINRTKDFQYYKEHFVLEIDNLLKRYLNETPYNISDEVDETESRYMNITSIIGTILAVFSLILIIPASFIATFGRDNKLIAKLQKANAKEVLNFISDPYLNSSFRDFCKQHQQLKHFLFLEKSLLFTEYCESIFNLNSVDNYATESADQQIDEFESKKCEIVFEILTEFLSSKGEYFLGEKQIGKKLNQRVKKEFKSNPMNLPDDLFTIIETNISVHLLPTLKLFKSNRKTKPIIQ